MNKIFANYFVSCFVFVVAAVAYKNKMNNFEFILNHRDCSWVRVNLSLNIVKISKYQYRKIIKFWVKKKKKEKEAYA